MRKETKALLQKNNQQETLLFPDFQSVLNNMVTYLRSTRLPYSLQEQARPADHPTVSGRTGERGFSR